jgi:hypothetical protein
LGGFFSKFKPKTQMKLPDDKNPTVRRHPFDSYNKNS